MPTYKNQRRGPLPIQLSNGDSFSVGGKQEFDIDPVTELSPRFRGMKNRGDVTLVKKKSQEPTSAPTWTPPVIVDEGPATPPEPEPETAPTSDDPGPTTAGEASDDSQTPEGETDAPASGSTESHPGKDAPKKETKRKRRRRRRKDS